MRGVVAAGLAVIAMGAQAAQDYTLVDIGTLGGPGSYGAAVSDNGTVVGCADVASGAAHAFVYRGGVIQDLGAAGDSAGGSSCALAVNNKGMIGGRSSTGELVIWNDSSLTRLGIKGDIGGINEAGVVVGTLADAGTSSAFMWTAGVLAHIAPPDSSAKAINARGEVVGASQGRAFLYASGALRDLGTLGGNSSFANGINSRGDVVGMSTNEFASPTPFIYHGTMRALAGVSFATALAVNNRGEVVGSGEGIRGFLVEGDKLIRLDTLPAVVAKGWRRLEPTGINDRGWIVGTATNPDGDLRAFLLIPGGEERTKPLRLR